MSKAIENRKIRIAIVGCGRIAKNHFGSIASHSDHLELVAVCDNNPSVLATHQQQYQVPGYAHLEDLLGREQLDLVALCTPSGLHPEQAIAVARHGISVMTEKPMATRWRDGYLLAAYNHFHTEPITSADIVDTFAGVRPLLKSASNPTQARRDYAFQRNGKLLTAFGGKWTTSLALAEKLIRKVNEQ